ncbi:hypothetical protein EP7_004314 [Isosphaeraceae bacterium EP7]
MGSVIVHHSCPVTRIQRMSVVTWNVVQEATLAARRKDFEAGRAVSAADETPDYGDFFFGYESAEDYLTGEPRETRPFGWSFEDEWSGNEQR